MKRLTRRLGFLAVTLLAVQVAMAQSSASCDKICKEPQRESEHIEIDANTGRINTLRLPQVDNVQLVFINKNPFKYRYRFEVVATSLDESILSTGIRLLGIPNFFQLGKENVPATTTCTAATTERDKLREALEAAAAAQGELKQFEGDLQAHEKFLEKTAPDVIKCEDVCPDAQLLAPALVRLTTRTKETRELLNDFKSKVEAARAALTAYAEAVKTAAGTTPVSAACKGAITNFERTVKLLEDGVKKDEEALTNVEKEQSQAQFKQLLQIINSLSPQSFTEIRFVPTSGEATNIRIAIHRRNLREAGATETVVATHDVRVGESRFSISGGLGWSTVQDIKVVRQRTVDPTDSSKFIEVFGEEDNSNLRPHLVAAVNARIGREGSLFYMKSVPAGFAWTAGLVVVDGSASGETEYFTGPSLVLLNHRLIFTLAYHSARVSHLDEPFRAGERIPADLKDPLPVDTDREGGLMLAITYRPR